MAFPNFPYTDFHRLNADWILKTVRACAQKVKEAAETVETYADRLLQVETDVTLLEGTVTTMNGTLTATAEKANGAVRFDVSQSLNNTQKTQARTNIGALSSADIPDVSDVVRTTAQTFTADEQRTACGNIKAVSYNTQSASPNERTTARANLQAVGYEAQTLTNEQKTQARTNIGALGSSDVPVPEGAVLYNEAQTLTDAQKAQARSNIGAVSASDIPQGVVRYDTSQSLSDEQESLARANISAEKVHTQVEIISQAGAIPWYTQGVFANILTAVTNGETVEVFTKPINQNRVYRGIFQLNTAGTHLQADLFALVENPYTSEYTKWYRVNWNSASVLNVTEESGRIAPTCVSADAGKVLTVSNSGIPVWVTPSGPLMVTFSGTTANGDAACDKTWAEISAAITAGKTIQLRYNAGGLHGYLYLLNRVHSNSISGYLTYIKNPASTNSPFISVSCEINSQDKVTIYKA